jgi:hypothetical protein
MALRIGDSVVRGEIDNRVKGVVRGTIWLQGMNEPLVLELKGNAAPDLAGCLLQISNLEKPLLLGEGIRLNPDQRGSIGDLTASRKVRVYEVPFDEVEAMIERGETPPEKMANCLYLEWFSQANGRVVIESTGFKLDVSPPLWRLDSGEEEQRQKEVAGGFDELLRQLTIAIESRRHHPPPDKKWDEYDYEKFMRECEARTDMLAELLDKYDGHPDAEQIIAREMGWNRKETSDDEAAHEGASDEDEAFTADPANLDTPEPDADTEGVDWIRTKEGHIRHPLACQAFEELISMLNELRRLGLEDCDNSALLSFVSGRQLLCVKLAGALDGLAYGRGLAEGAFLVACLKRALSHLHKTQADLEKVIEAKLLPPPLVARCRRELFETRDGILRLMQEFRNWKE